MHLISAFFVALSATIFVCAQVKRPEPPKPKPDFDLSQQIVVVTTPEWGSAKGEARLFERSRSRSAWRQLGQAFPVVVGRNGLALDRDFWRFTGDEKADLELPLTKKEGDGRSPAGLFPLTFAFGVEKPETKLPFTKLERFTECVDDVNSNHYNRIVDRMKVGAYDWKSSEKMLEVGPQYALGVFVAYNSYPVIPGNGSCIFLHIWKDPNTGTSGCTAMEREDLERIVKWLEPAKNPFLIQLPGNEYQGRRKQLNLPKL